MIDDYSSEIKISIFQSISERQSDSQIASESRQKLWVLTM